MKDFIVDGNVTQQDYQKIRLEAQTKGWGQLACELLENEPVLAEMMSLRWGKIMAMMEGLGLTPVQSDAAMQQMARLMVETIGVVQRSSRRLWDDMLPDAVDDAQK